MDATYMPANTLLNKLQKDYPKFIFKPADHFMWSTKDNILSYNLTLPKASALLLHELAHALLKHNDYTLDIELIKKERVAWDYAKDMLAPRYDLVITDDQIEDAMDSYRDWLHQRSLCPECETSGLQTKTGPYKCVACGCRWRANDARKRELRRYRLV